MTTTANITTAQITALRDEAAIAGDLSMAAICRRALNGSASARAKCARVIADAAAQDDGDCDDDFYPDDFYEDAE